MKASGRFVLRIPPLLHQKLRREALEQETSLNQVVLRRLENGSVNPPYLAPISRAFQERLMGIAVFGSAVRDERRADSDIDLLIVLSPQQPITRSLYALWDEKVREAVTEEYSPQFVHLPDLDRISSLWLEVAMEGEVTYDPQGVLKKNLRAIRERIAAGEYIRKVSHGHPYWTHVNRGDPIAK